MKRKKPGRSRRQAIRMSSDNEAQVDHLISARLDLGQLRHIEGCLPRRRIEGLQHQLRWEHAELRELPREGG